MAAVGARLLLKEEGDGHFSVVFHHAGGTEERLPALTPAEALIAAVETDYSDYRREVRRLWEEHPLFEERLDISVADLEDFVAEALRLAANTRKSRSRRPAPPFGHIVRPVGKRKRRRQVDRTVFQVSKAVQSIYNRSYAPGFISYFALPFGFYIMYRLVSCHDHEIWFVGDKIGLVARFDFISVGLCCDRYFQYKKPLRRNCAASRGKGYCRNRDHRSKIKVRQISY